MRFIRPEWVRHVDEKGVRGTSIFSIAAHPDGTRLATGALDAKVRIWSTRAILDASRRQQGSGENDAASAGPELPKCLSTLTHHNGVVLCVRWSPDGRYLASGSDDTIIMIWEWDRADAATPTRSFGSNEINLEHWKPIRRLIGHSTDVTDLAWSQDGGYLASVGLDNLVLIWDTSSWVTIHRMTSHTGFVKGVAWDPVGQYLATQSDDKTVKIWKTADWSLETEIEKPFVDSAGATFFRRLSWSPDGNHIVTANATNGPVNVAAVIKRTDWTSQISLVGHEDAIECAAFNPRVAKVKTDQTISRKNVGSLVALGAQDRSLSVWFTKANNPICVAKHIFERAILDLSWSADGLTLWACSSDGTIAVIDFDPQELRQFAEPVEQAELLSTFGYARPRHMIKSTATLLPVGSLQKPNVLKARKAGAARPTPVFAPNPGSKPVTACAPGSKAQNISILANGKRRIQPQLVAGIGSSGQSEMMMPPPPLISKVAPVSLVANGIHPNRPSSFASTPDQTPHQPIALLRQSMQSAQDTQSPDFDWGAPSRNPAAHSMSPVSKRPRLLGEDMDVDMGDSLDPSREAAAGPRGVVAREGRDVLGMPRKASSRSIGPPKGLGSGARPDAQDSTELRPTTFTGPSRDWLISQTMTTLPELYPPKLFAGALKPALLPIPVVRDVITTAGRPKVSRPIECHNFDDPDRPSTVTCAGEKGVAWLEYLPSAALLCCANGYLNAVACEDGTVRVLSQAGRQLQAPLALDSPAAFLECAKYYLMTITVLGTVMVWDIKGKKAAFSPISVEALLAHPKLTVTSVALRPNAVPVVTLSNGTVYGYSPQMLAWQYLSGKWYAQASDVWESTRDHGQKSIMKQLESSVNEIVVKERDSIKLRGGLAIESEKKGEVDLPGSKMTGEDWSASISLAHLEARLNAADLLDSPLEYKLFLVQYAKRIADEGFRDKAEELVRELIGPIYHRVSTSTNPDAVWSPTVLGMQKRDLLKDVLSVFTRSRFLSRLGSDWSEILRNVTSAKDG